MRYQSLKLNISFYYYYFFFTEWFQTEKEFTNVFEKVSPQELNKSLQSLCVNTAKPLWLSQFQACPSPLPGHLSGICHFVLEKLQIPHPGTTSKLYFPVNKLKYHFYRKSLIVRSKRVNPLRKSSLAASYN